MTNLGWMPVALVNAPFEHPDLDLSLSEFVGMLSSAGIGSYVWYINDNRAEIDAELSRLLGFEGGAQDLPATAILDKLDASDRLAIEGEAAAAIAERRAMKWNFRLKRDNGDVVWIASRAAPIIDADGQCRRIAGINFDVTENMQRLIHSGDVAGEMGHRVKNILTVVIGMTRLLDADNMTGAEFKTSMLERLQGLSGAHDLIYKETAVVTVPELARRVIWAVGGHERIQISGPPTLVSDQAAQAITMVLTELTTNALKHGALRGDVAGRINLAFDVREEENRFELIWEETSDVPISVPKKTGYGSMVLDRLTASTLNGKPSFDWQASGLAYRCHWPLDRVTDVPDDAAPTAIVTEA